MVSKNGFKPEEKLYGLTNFNSWKARLTTILDENDLDDIVLNVTEEPTTNVGRLAYKRKQGKARRIIYELCLNLDWGLRNFLNFLCHLIYKMSY